MSRPLVPVLLGGLVVGGEYRRELRLCVWVLSLWEWEWCDMLDSDVDIDEFDTDDRSSSSGVEDGGKVLFLFLYWVFIMWLCVISEFEESEKFEFQVLMGVLNSAMVS